MMYIFGGLLLPLLLIAFAHSQTDRKNDWKCSEVHNSCLFGQCQYECLGATCNAEQTHVLGDEVLILDHKSLYYSGGDSHPVVLASAKDCCDECKRMEECNAYAFCNNQTGCGAGCQEYIANNPDVNPAGELPLKGFGPYGGCFGDKYPYQMCKLMIVNSQNGYATSNQGSPGFISGVFDPKPDRCGNLTRFACEACDNSDSFEECYGCAIQPDIPTGSEHYCAKCPSLNLKYQGKCNECIGDFGVLDGCGYCMVTLEEEKCLECASNFYSARVQYECSLCAVRENYDLCVNCLESEKIDNAAKIHCAQCTRDPVPTNFQEVCVECMEREEGINGSLCGSCAVSATDLDQCFQCLETIQGDHRRFCPTCSSDDYPKQCYQCLLNEEVQAKVHCTTCAIRSNHMDLCVECLKGADAEAALRCTKCAQTENEEACLTCLIKQEDEVSQQFCNQCSTTLCQECVANNTGSTVAQAACIQCQNLGDPQAIDLCTQCISDIKGPGSGSCSFCAASDDPVSCIECMKVGNKIDPFIAQSCPSCVSIKDEALRKECLNCLVSADTSEAALACSQCAIGNVISDGSCFGCVASAKSTGERQACYQ